MYNSFPNFVLRTPLLSFSFFEDLTSNQNISDNDFKKLFDKPEIKEAIFLATPVLYNELEKWINNRIEDQCKIEKLKYSLLKYVSRMSSRCTPFGLFAGCVVGTFGVETNIILDTISNNKRHTRLDMNYLVALSQNLAKIENIKKQILFFPNTSIYKSGNQLRYVEYEYINNVRQHNIMAVDDSIYLQKILKASERGKTMKEIIDLLVDDDNSFGVVADFVEELISSQILVSELEPSTSGPEFLDHIKNVLLNLKDTQAQLNIINCVETNLSEIDNHIGNNPIEYIEISNNIKELGTDFDVKYLFQTDVILKTKSNVLNHSIIDSVKQGISIFNKITLPPKDTLLNNFKEAFYERFEDREVSLSKALDVEMGIGYKQNQEFLDNNPLIDDILFPSNEKTKFFRDVKWSKIHSIFHKKIIEALARGDFYIRLTDKDFEEFEEDWTDLPDTISTMIEIVMIKGKEKILINDAGNSSSANPFGRFCHGDQILKDYTQSITNMERDMNKTKILAEINHLPESRLGNVLLRPVFREYEIPYLAKSTLNNENQLKIDDLYISVKNKNIQLRSMNHNKEVIPRLSNSHNYSSNSLPIYHFLCDMQTQNKRAGIGLDLGPFVNEYEFIPRIEYKNLILSVAMWNIKELDIVPLLSLNKNDSELIEEFRLFRRNRKIPQYFMLIDGDNQLLINSKNLTSVKMFLNTVKNKSNFKIKEFLFHEEGIVRSSDDQEYYTNQIILSFYNSTKLKND